MKKSHLLLVRFAFQLVLCCVSCVLTAGDVQPIVPKAPSAEEAAPVVDVGTELAAARKAWHDGDRLGKDARRNFEVLKKQEKAYENASIQFSKAVKKDSRNPFVRFEYGRFCLAQSQFIQARSHLDLACFVLQEERSKREKNPQYRPRYVFDKEEEADLYRTVGGLLERAAEFSQAEDRYWQAVKLDPSNLKNELSLATCLYASGRPEDALKRLTPLVEQWEKSQTKSLTPTPILSPTQAANHALLLYTMAICQEETSRLEDALQSYQRAAELSGKAGLAESLGIEEYAIVSSWRVEDFLDGMHERTLQREKENEERLKNNQKVLPVLTERANLADATTLCLTGVSLKNTALADKQFVSALPCIRTESMQINSDAESALENHDNYEPFLNAMKNFDAAIQKYPRLGRAYHEWALWSMLMGRFGTARPLCDAAVLYNPNNLAFLNLQGQVLLELGQWDKAASVFKHLLTLEPEAGSAHWGLARVLAATATESSQIELALDTLDRAEHLGVRDSRIHSATEVVLKNGRKITGTLLPDSKEELLVLKTSDTIHVIKKEYYSETHARLGMREQLLDLKARLERGESLPKGPVLRAKKQQEKRKEDPMWGNTIFQR